MKVLSFLAFLVGATASEIQSSSVSPLFIWSPKSYFTDESKCTEEVPDLLEVTDVASAIQYLSEETKTNSDDSPLLRYFSQLTHETEPEAIIAFMYKQLDTASTSQLSGAYDNAHDAQPLSFLQELFSKSKSCLSIPYLNPEGSISTSLVLAIRNNVVDDKPKPQVVSLDLHDCDAAIAAIKKKSKLFSNKVTDLFLIEAESSTSISQKCLRRVMKLIKAKTSNFVALLSADSASPIAMSFDAKVRRMMEVPKSFAFSGASVSETNGSSVSPIDIDNVKQYSVVVVAIPISLFMIMMLWIGMGCLMDIETPVRFANKNLVISREG